ncbi:MAG: alpha/beta hydrolase [Lachnospiraceae bacterium]|nr:alpha/beta hydrolase [Lachnospiraceae bacterium]
MIKYLDINNPGYSIKCKVFCDNFREIEHVVLFAHGFGGHKDNKAAAHFAETMLSKTKKYAMFLFDWPCHGTDVRKKLTLEDCDTYLTMVLDYIRNVMKVEDICLYGTSFGGYLVLKYLHDHGTNPFRKIALRCPAVNIGEVMSERILTEENKALLARGKDVMAGFDRTVMIDQAFLDSLFENDIRKWDYIDYADDCLVLHGTKDEIVPFEISRAFAENNVIEFIPIEDSDHRFQDLNKLKLAHSHMLDFYTGKR